MMEKIILSENQITELYNENLLIIRDEYPDQSKETAEHKIEFKGGFSKKILWLHNEADHTYLNDLDFEMLTKILEACKMSWEDIAFVNLYHSGKDHSLVIQKLNPDYVILSIGDQNNYQIQTSAERKILYTHALCDIRSDKNLKIRLWQALKLFFELN